MSSGSGSSPRVVLLCGGGFSSRVVARRLAERFELVRIIVERPPSKRKLIERRAKRIGWPAVVDMLAFQVCIAPVLSRRSRARIRELQETLDLRGPPFDEREIVRVESVNERSVAEELRSIRPDVVVINGTRIVRRRVLSAVGPAVPFINLHAGITPRYRGVHGGYWALAEQRPDLCGVTVHIVDRGVDTGGVLAQALVRPGPDDGYATLPYLQLAAGLPLVLAAVDELVGGNVRTIDPPCDESRLRYHPRASGYLYRRWLYGVI